VSRLGLCPLSAVARILDEPQRTVWTGDDAPGGGIGAKQWEFADLAVGRDAPDPSTLAFGEPQRVIGPGDEAPGRVARIGVDGRIREFPLPEPDRYPNAIGVGPDGALW
jgi:hypothetical protein